MGIVGADAPQGKPQGPFEGIELDPNITYEEKIESICLTRIKEPIFPEMMIPNPVNNKTFIVIRVAESSLTPHRIAANTTVYIRTGQSSVPNEKADWEKMEWLLSKRHNSIDLRNQLLERAEEYFTNACTIQGIDITDRGCYFAILSLKAIPLFPQIPLVPYTQLQNIQEKISVGTHSGRFPRDLFDPHLIQNGVQKLHIAPSYSRQPKKHGVPFDYILLDTYGTYLYKKDIGALKKNEIEPQGKDRKTTDLYNILLRTNYFLQSIRKYYQYLGYFGSIAIDVELKNALGVELYNPLYSSIVSVYDEEARVTIPSNHIKWKRELSVPRLEDEAERIVLELAHEIAWSLNMKQMQEEHIKKMLSP